MNKSMIRYLLSKLLLIEAVLLLVPVAVALYYRESSQVFTAPLYNDWNSGITRWLRNFTKAKKSTDLCQGGNLDCGPLLNPLVLLWWSPLCLFWANP